MSKQYILDLIAMSDSELDAELSSVKTTEFSKALKIALKEQDRDTRHACAEAVIQCPEDVSGECIWKDDAHNACMNVEAL